MSDTKGIAAPGGEFLVYVAENGHVQVQVRLEGETVWLTQAAIAELFQTTPQNVTMHLAAIYEEAELTESATCKDFLQVRQEGNRDVRRALKHYNLAAVLAVGYRVRSAQGTWFRQWATARLEEYVVKGFTIDDQRLKNPPGFDGPDYFDELLARIRRKDFAWDRNCQGRARMRPLRIETRRPPVGRRETLRGGGSRGPEDEEEPPRQEANELTLILLSRPGQLTGPPQAAAR